jgi:hypothetical protein
MRCETKNKLRCLWLMALILCVFAFPIFACAASGRDAQPKFAFMNKSAVAWRYAKPCRDAPAGSVEDYSAYMQKFDELVTSLKSSQLTPEEVQQKINDYRDGLAAREIVYGPCPGRCLSYNFPVLFNQANKDIAKRMKVDRVVDLTAVFYGADKVIGGANATNDVFDQVEKLKAW